MRILTGILCLLPLLSAQETRHEVTNRDKDDAKPNSSAVPDVYAIPGAVPALVVLRFKYDTDLVAGLERMVKEQKIKNGVILNGWGSVRGYQIHQVSNRTLPSKNMFVKDPTPARRHRRHERLRDEWPPAPAHHPRHPRKSFGGHLEPGTTVFTFAVITIGVLPDNLDVSRLDDKNYR